MNCDQRKDPYTLNTNFSYLRPFSKSNFVCYGLEFLPKKLFLTKKNFTPQADSEAMFTPIFCNLISKFKLYLTIRASREHPSMAWSGSQNIHITFVI